MTSDDTTPILSYAGVDRGRQPLDSLFVVTETADGVTVTKPLAAEPVRAALAYLIGLGMAAIVVVAVVGLLSDLHRPWYEFALAPLPLATPCCFGAAATIYAMAVDGPRTLSIVIDPAGMTITNGPVTFAGRPWRVGHPVQFRAGMATPDVGRMRLASALLLKAGRSLEKRVLPTLPAAECRWLADVLNNGVARATVAAGDTPS